MEITHKDNNNLIHRVIWSLSAQELCANNGQDNDKATHRLVENHIYPLLKMCVQRWRWEMMWGCRRLRCRHRSLGNYDSLPVSPTTAHFTLFSLTVASGFLFWTIDYFSPYQFTFPLFKFITDFMPNFLNSWFNKLYFHTLMYHSLLFRSQLVFLLTKYSWQHFMSRLHN